MALFVVANTVYIYTLTSKVYMEQTLPKAEELDKWTENIALWNTTATVSRNNYDDYINGTYYGNKSIEFSIANSQQISMWLNDIDPINCSGPDGYKNLYLRIKWISPSDKPQNITIYLFSATPSNYFCYNLTEKFSNSTVDIWNNLTIPIGSEAWLSNSAAANWESVTGLKLEFTWPKSSSITLLVDGLFFGGVFKPPVEDVASYILNFSVYSFMQFFVKWVFLGGLFYIMIKAFGVKTVWRPLLILAGFTLATMFVQALVNAAVFSTLPQLYYPFELLGGVEGETEIAYNTILEKTWLVSQISGYIQVGVYVWTIALGAIATRSLTEFTWTKSFLIATLAYFASMMVESLILGY